MVLRAAVSKAVPATAGSREPWPGSSLPPSSGPGQGGRLDCSRMKSCPSTLHSSDRFRPLKATGCEEDAEQDVHVRNKRVTHHQGDSKGMGSDGLRTL